MRSVNIFGLNVRNTTLSGVMGELENSIRSGSSTTIATPNTEIAMKSKDNPQLVELINSFDVVVPDGIGLVYAAKIKGFELKERVTGYDISLGLLELGPSLPLKLFLLGSKPGIAELARENIEVTYPGISVVGVRDGYFTPEDEAEIISQINEAKPDVVFVGLGFPKQEEFIHRNKDKLNFKIIIGNGGVIDILAGVNKRAPEIFIKLNLEWLYRLLQQPSRIVRQLAIPKFIFNVLIDKNAVKKGDR